jgi:hypothetical protein
MAGGEHVFRNDVTFAAGHRAGASRTEDVSLVSAHAARGGRRFSVHVARGSGVFPAVAAAATRVDAHVHVPIHVSFSVDDGHVVRTDDAPVAA